MPKKGENPNNEIFPKFMGKLELKNSLPELQNYEKGRGDGGGNGLSELPMPQTPSSYTRWVLDE